MKVEAITSVNDHVLEIATRARGAARLVGRLTPEVKEQALLCLAALLRTRASFIGRENQKDLRSGEKNGLSSALLDRLRLNETRIEAMAEAVEQIAAAVDPVGEVVSQWTRPGGFEVGQVRIPLGVVGIIYESRPNVTADASALCFKAGNAAILRGGSEAIHSNLAIGRCIREAFEQTGVTPDAVQLIETTSREAVGALLKMDSFVDVIIPRGGKALIQRVFEESLIPVIKHFEGICHTFVHREADPEMAIPIVINAKVQRPGTCNALETLLIDAPIADSFVPRVVAELRHHGVLIRGCPRTVALAQVDQQAVEDDYRREYLSLECNVRVVDDLESATQHIADFGSRHTDVIVTESYAAARAFVRRVDSSSVMVNASSRLADGGVYGLGAEIGISTDKLHAFGPMGVRELTTKKFVVYGHGAVRS